MLVEADGQRPTSGTITISGAKIYSVSFTLEDRVIGQVKDSGLGIATYKAGEPIYFDVTNGKSCKESEAVSTTGTKTGCMKFYVIKDYGGAIELILDHNTTNGVAWTTSSTNVEGPINLINQLKADTDSWQGVIEPNSYTMDQSTQTSTASYTIEYNKARLLSAQDLASITGNTTWDEKTARSYFYFDSKTSSPSPTCDQYATTGCNYGWLYDRTFSVCEAYGCNNNDSSGSDYWTVSSTSYVNYKAWAVIMKGYISVYDSNTSRAGVRPVITILKSLVS